MCSFCLRQLSLQKFQSRFARFLLTQGTGEIAAERGDLAFPLPDLTLKVLNGSFDILPLRPELIRLFLLFLELLFFQVERFENGAQLLIRLFQQASAGPKSFPRPPRRLSGIAPTTRPIRLSAPR